MPSKIEAFLKDQSGAVTVDWVVLTAAIIGLGFMVLVPIAYGTDSLATQVTGRVTVTNVGYGSNP